MNEQTFKVVKLLALQKGVTERGEWKSQDVILEEVANVQYPDRWLVTYRGEKVDMLKGISEGDTVKAQWSSKVRSYTCKDGREGYQQQHNGWKIENLTSF